jgi:hypothetical protein
MHQPFQQPFTSLGIPQQQFGPFGLGGGLGQVPFASPFGQPSPFGLQGPIAGVGQWLGQQSPLGYPYGQPQFIPPTVNPYEVATILTRVLPLLLQSGSLLQVPQMTPFGGQPQLGSIIGQNPYAPFQSGLFQNPIGGLGSLGSPWGTPFGHY